MSEEITLQENETVERTIEVSIDKNGLGIESGQVFPSVTVDFAPILCVTRVPWENIIGRPPIESGEGQDSIVLGTSGAYASGQNSIAQGTSIASGRNSHAEGHETNAFGASSHSEGISTSATGNYSHSEGASTSAGGYSSHAEGYGTMTLNNAEHAQGIFNVSHAESLGDYEYTLFSIGIGNGSTERANAVEVMRGGDIFVFGIGDYDGTTTNAASLQEVIFSANREISDKADKVVNATQGNFAALDSNGNLVDSGHTHGDYITSHQDISGKQDKTAITTVSDSTLTQEIADNTIYNAGELSALTITLPKTIAADFISEIDFTSGTTATTLIAPNTIKWAGDDLTSNVFVPAASKRYTVMFYSDGVNVRAVVQGIDIQQ